MQGRFYEAAEQARISLEEAVATGYELTICHVLRLATCPVAFETGDLAAAEQGVAKLVDIATRFNAPFWRSTGRCLEGKLKIAQGAFAAGSALLRSELDACERTGWTTWYPEFLGVLAEGLAGLRRLPEALATVDRALAEADQGGERYYAAELLRLKGEFLVSEADGEHRPAIEDCFQTALAVAREQGALLFELRTALSLGRWRIRLHLPEDARTILAPVYGRFVEGFDAADLRAARALIAHIGDP